MRLITDVFAFCAKDVPKWNTISVSGYHIREAGSTSLQELAFTLRDGIEYVQYGIDAGLDVDDFAPRISFFFNSHSDFFEEIAKFRAARRLWAEVMRDRFGAKDERSWKLRFHTQTAGVSLTAQQPYNNVVRTALQALAAVLGGTNSLHTNSLDEALALPTSGGGDDRAADAAGHRPRERRDARRRSARRVVLRREADARDGATARASTSTPSTGWAAWSTPSRTASRRRRLPRARTGSSRQSSRSDKIIVGVNDFVHGRRASVPDPLHRRHGVRHADRRACSTCAAPATTAAVSRTLDGLRDAARTGANTMYPLLDCVRAYATVGEMCDALRQVWGEYEEVPTI